MHNPLAFFYHEEHEDKKEDEAFGSDKHGDELFEGLKDRESRLNRLKACKERLERQQEQARQEQQEKIDQRKAKEEATGRGVAKRIQS